MDKNIVLLGVFFLGGFVGFILGGALRLPQSISVKAGLSILGAALGGVPIAFMGGLTYEKWMYPIGLVFGLLWVRVVGVRHFKLTGSGERKGIMMAWLDVIAILSATLVIIIITAFLK
jgi:hypothetical protein